MITLLGFGSSARRGATGWTDRARVRAVIDACCPDETVDGKSPAGGADQVFWEEAVMYFRASGDGIPARRCPVERDHDGPWPAAGHRRNARMYRTYRPTIAAGFISGKVGSPLSSGSAGMLRICREGLGDRPPIPVVVYRDDGIEPVTPPLRTMRLLSEIDTSLTPLYLATNAHLKGETSREEVLAALAFAAEGSRWAPWIEAVRASLRVG